MTKASKTISSQKKINSMLRNETKDDYNASAKSETVDRSEQQESDNPIEKIFKLNKETGQYGDYGIYL